MTLLAQVAAATHIDCIVGGALAVLLAGWLMFEAGRATRGR